MFAGVSFAFEVMDKEWPIWFVLAGFVGLGFFGMLATKKWPITSVIFLLLIGIAGVKQISEINDPYVGPAIKAEAGKSYVVLSYSAIAASVALVCAGAIKGLKRRTRASAD